MNCSDRANVPEFVLIKQNLSSLDTPLVSIKKELAKIKKAVYQQSNDGNGH